MCKLVSIGLKSESNKFPSGHQTSWQKEVPSLTRFYFHLVKRFRCWSLVQNFPLHPRPRGGVPMD